jgi:ankyrin repeat protein
MSVLFCVSLQMTRGQSNMENQTPHNTVSVQLLQAIKDDLVAKLEGVLQKYPVKDHLYDYGNALCLAAREGFGGIVNILLDAGCMPDGQDHNDTIWFRKPIHNAAAKGHVSIVKRLLECGVDINSVDNQGKTPLHWAAAENCLPVTEYLIQNGAAVDAVQNYGFTALHSVSSIGHWKMAQYLLSEGALVNRAAHDGWTPLHAAACYGHLDMVSLLLDHGASVDARTTSMYTPLHLALCCGHVSILHELRAANADLEARERHGNTPFLVSISENRCDASRYLIGMGADVDTTNDSDQSAINITGVLMWGHLVNLLLDAGCDVQNEPWLHPFLTAAKWNVQWLNDVLFYIKNSRNLQQLSKICIRKQLGQRKNQKTKALPIPQRLQNFLTVGNVPFQQCHCMI